MQCILEISLKKIKSNWEKINKYSNFRASAVVKANAYGFGLEEIAIALSETGCNFFYVAQIEEGIKLRNCLKSNKIKIGILEGMVHNPEEYKKNNLIPVINNLNQLNNFIKFKNLSPQIRGILHIDTGMNRLGLDKNELDFALENISHISSVDFEFIMTHFSNSNVQNDNFNNIQYKKILKINSYFKNKKISLSNTGGILLDKKYILDQTRPGIGIYGYDANGKNIILNNKKLDFPAKLKAPILQIRFCKTGDKVSYGRTERLNRDSKLATIGIGYGDGVLRLLKETMSIVINGKTCPIIGSITMDSLIIDITDVEKDLKVGSYLELINQDFFINWNRSELGLSIYELFTLISNRVIRQYV